MNKSFCLTTTLLVWGMAFSLSAQDSGNGLVFSEVYLDSIQPGDSWVEVHNPTDQPLTLERFRLSHIRALDILPPEIRRQGVAVIIVALTGMVRSIDPSLGSLAYD